MFCEIFLIYILFKSAGTQVVITKKSSNLNVKIILVLRDERKNVLKFKFTQSWYDQKWPFVSIVDALQPPLSNCPLGYADFGFV